MRKVIFGYLIKLVASFFVLIAVANYFQNPYHNFFTSVSLLTALCLVALICNSLYAIKNFYQKKNIDIKLAFVGLTVLPLMLVLAHFPGWVVIDDLFLLQNLEKGIPHEWSSLSYSVLQQACLFLFGSNFHISWLNLVLYINLLLLVLSLEGLNFKKISFWIVTVIFVLPASLSTVLFQNRDSTYTLLLLLGLMKIITRAYRLEKSKYDFWIIIAIFLIVAEMRRETTVLLFLVPVFFYFTDGYLKKPFYLSACTLIAAISIFFGIKQLQGTRNSIPNHYKAMVLVNPLSSILKEKGLESLNEKQRKDFESYLDLNYLVELQSEYEIDPFYKQAIKPNRSQQDYSAFTDAAFSFIWSNIDLFLKNRIMLVTRMFNFDRGAYLDSDDAKSSIHPPFEPGIAFFKYRLKNFDNNFIEANYSVYRQKIFYELPAGLHFIFSTPLIPILSLIFGVLLFRGHPVISLLCAFLLLRAGVMIALSPCSFFKYITSVWLGGWLALVLIFLLKNEFQKKV